MTRQSLKTTTTFTTRCLSRFFRWVGDIELLLQVVASPVVSNLKLEWHQHADNPSDAGLALQQAPVALPSMHAGCRTVV